MQSVQSSRLQYYCWHNTNLRLELHIKTRAGKDAIIGNYGERLKVAVTAIPFDGKANKKLTKLLAKYFAVSQSQVQIVSGTHSRYKSVLILNPKQNVCCYPK